MLTLVIAFATFCVFVGYLYTKSPTKHPPGPFALPLLGTIELLRCDLVKSLDKFAATYGNIFCIQIGPIKTLVLYSSDIIRKAFAEDALCGRPTSDLIEHRNGGKRGLIFNDGPPLQELRRFALRSLKELGLGKSAMEEAIKAEVTAVSEYFQSLNGNRIDLKGMMNHAVINAVWQITTGERFDFNDPVSQKWFRHFTEGVHGSNFLTYYGPKILRKIYPPAQRMFDEHIQLIEEVKVWIQSIIDKHRTQPSRNDLITLFLREAEKAQPDSVYHGEEGIQNLLISLMDLLNAGHETTATSLTWFFLLMALYPDVQSKVQDEIDGVLGKYQPTNDDRAKLPYTDAVINESMRYISVGPIGIPHKVSKDCEFYGYALPKGLFVIADLHAVMHDPNVWEKPNEFYPEHFLTKSEQKRDSFIPFGVGKRYCLGENIARMQIFLFGASLLQQFTFRLPEDVKYEVNLTSSFIRGPEPFQLIITSRQ